MVRFTASDCSRRMGRFDFDYARNACLSAARPGPYARHPAYRPSTHLRLAKPLRINPAEPRDLKKLPSRAGISFQFDAVLFMAAVRSCWPRAAAPHVLSVQSCQPRWASSSMDGIDRRACFWLRGENVVDGSSHRSRSSPDQLSMCAISSSESPYFKYKSLSDHGREKSCMGTNE